MQMKFNINLPNTVFLIFLLLPLIGGLKILSFTVLAKILNIAAYLIISLILAKVSKKFLMLIGFMFFIKVIYFIFGYEILQTIFLICAMILIGSFSALYFITAPEKFYRFVNLYLLITVPIVIFQALGVFDFLHSWNTLFFSCDELGRCQNTGNIVNIIGENFNDLIVQAGQYRPPGLFHSQALLGAFLSFAIVLTAYQNINKVSIGLIACIILVVFGLSKITQIQLIMIAIFFYFQYGLKGISKSFKIILIWGLLLLIYSILTPGLLSAQLNMEQYIFSATGRMLDFYSYIHMPELPEVETTAALLDNKQALREITGVGVQIAASKEEIGQLSGMRHLIWMIPILTVFFYATKRIYKIYGNRILLLKYKLPFKMYFSLLIFTVVQMMVTDTFGTQFVMFFWGLLAVPFYCINDTFSNKFGNVYIIKLRW
jgi:hypothetical protein